MSGSDSIRKKYGALVKKKVMARVAILSLMKFISVGVASSHDDRGRMPLPQKKR